MGKLLNLRHSECLNFLLEQISYEEIALLSILSVAGRVGLCDVGTMALVAYFPENISLMFIYIS